MLNFRNALKLDLVNYLLYQNYNLQRKGLNYRFQFSDLYQLFSSRSLYHEFKLIVKQVINELSEIANLNVQEIDKNSFLLIGTKEATLYRHERRKTNPDPDQPIQISKERLEKLEKQYSKLEILSAITYMENIKNDIENPYGYMKEVLRNPSWYRKERTKTIDLIHETQISQYKKLKDSERKVLYNELVKRINITPISNVSHDLEIYLNQLKRPGNALVKVPKFEYCVYLYWASLRGLLTETNNTHNEKQIIKLFTELMH